MKNKIIKIFFPITTMILVFFISVTDVKAVDKCSWLMYQSYITTTDTGTYDVNTFSKSVNNNKFKWILKYDRKWANDFRIVENSTDYVKKFSSSKFKKTLINSKECPKYVVVSADGNNETVKETTSTAFKNYYKSQYDGILRNASEDKNVFTYYSYFIDDISKKPIVFIRDDSIKYPSEHLNETKKISKKFEPTNFGISDCNTTCSSGIQEFYNATKTKWFNQVNSLYSDIVCKNGSCSMKNKNLSLKIAFSQWFTDEIARLVFEEDYEQFLICYKLKKLSSGLGKNFSKEDFIIPKDSNNKIESIESIIKIDNSTSDREEIEKNPCESLCYYGNETAKENCRKSSSYNQCTTAYSSCKNISSSSSYEQCMKSRMGEDNFNNFNTSLSKVLNSIDQTISSEQEKLNYYLKQVEAPDFEGITFEPGYKTQCEDVEFIHFIYAVMRVIAPIIVILFSTLDYTKSVFAANEEKILEARKKFPKRLVLLILFILVPVIIDFILGVFAGDTSLMRCIINGK